MNTTTQKRNVGRPRKEETTTTKRDFENEILGVKKVIEDLRSNYHEIETSFTSRVEKIKDKMYGDYMERRRIYEEEVERLTKKIVKQETRKFVEGQILTMKSWSEKCFVLVTKTSTDEHGYRFYYNTIGVSGVGSKTNRCWVDITNREKLREIEVVCDTKNFVSLCEKYGIKKPKLNKLNTGIIYEGIFNKKLNGEFNYSDLQKLGIITK